MLAFFEQVKAATDISPLHHCRGTAAGHLRRSTTQEEEPRGQWDNTPDHVTFKSGTVTQEPLGLPPTFLVSLLPVTSFPRTNLRLFTHGGKSKFGVLGIVQEGG